MKYKVFWIDDAHEKQEAFKEQAYEMGLELRPYRSLDDLKILFENYKDYDSVLLDVRFIEKDDSEEPPNSYWASKARDQILSFEKKKFEFVFYSGETDIFSDEEGFKNTFRNEVFFRKGLENKKCINKLIELSQNQESFEIKRNYHDAFEACIDIGGGSEELLLSLIKQCQNNLDINITNIRMLMESIFDSYKKKGLAPQDLEDTGVSMFICGLEANCKNKKFIYQFFGLQVTVLMVWACFKTKNEDHQKHFRKF